MALPYAYKLEVAFDTGPTDPLPNWADCTDYVLDVEWGRGKGDRNAVIQPGKATFSLDSTDGTFLQDYPSGPYYGMLLPNRRVRWSMQETALSSMVAVWTGFSDSWVPTRDGDSCEVTLACTDRQKLFGFRTNTGTTIAEPVDDRLIAILDNGDTGGLNAIVIPAEYSINPNGYTCRSLVARVYGGEETSQNLHDAVLSDGGWLFLDADGVVVFQPQTFRTLNSRATTSQVTLGNTAGAVPVEGDLDPPLSEDEIANYITATAGDGSVHTDDDPTSIDLYGRREIDLGNTLLTAVEAADRVSDLLAQLKDPLPRVQELTMNCAADDDAAAEAFDREISDRVTVENIPGDLGEGLARDYWIEAIKQKINFPAGSWTCAFTLSPTPDAPVEIP